MSTEHCKRIVRIPTSTPETQPDDIRPYLLDNENPDELISFANDTRLYFKPSGPFLEAVSLDLARDFWFKSRYASMLSASVDLALLDSQPNLSATFHSIDPAAAQYLAFREAASEPAHARATQAFGIAHRQYLSTWNSLRRQPR